MKPSLLQGRKLLAFVCMIHFFLSSFSQYSTQGPLSGSSFSNDNSIGNFAFSIPGYAVTSDDDRSSAKALLVLLNGNTHYLKVTGFNFSVPSLATITGIKVEVEKSAWDISILATVRDNQVRLVKGGSVLGDNKAVGTPWTDDDNYNTYGDTTDIWGTTLTPTDVNAADFGVVFSAKINGLLSLIPSARVDHIRVTVFYLIALPIHFLDFTIKTKNENKVLLEWTTADNDERVLFTVQRSTDALSWIDLQTITGAISFNTKKYYYTDYVSFANCRFYYRIKMKLTSGAFLFTRIVFADIGIKGGFSLFPNPAKNEVYISTGEADAINLFSINGKKIKLNFERISSKQIKINTSSLPPGLYVVKAGDQEKQLMIH
jgi:hypothetical protein